MSETQKVTNTILGFKENLTGYNAVISSDHAYIHKGIGFNALVDLGSISAPTYISVLTPAASTNKYIHWRPTGLQSSADYLTYKMTEADTSTGGDAVTPINRNRLSSNTADVIVTKGVTSTPAGTLIQLFGIGVSGNTVARSGGGAQSEEEIVLKQNTKYIIEITPAGATSVTMELFWYEEEAGITNGV